MAPVDAKTLRYSIATNLLLQKCSKMLGMRSAQRCFSRQSATIPLLRRSNPSHVCGSLGRRALMEDAPGRGETADETFYFV
ncbi:MAG: hypothetical protein MRY74_10075 [Neomegalonema sp.]|nr:hypothetical protein [Neomegalonema sp.]